ncbi:hypothetical protein CDL15_Pgr028501 [Punica granatum]|uniref:DNA polymerase kappa n=2 Tax=Punica granatum TaxID=22663 RepID=A0A218VW32_PUNGR|nr:hypothetical protein CDL15_Pgr028501 [Punica granatum]
MKEKAIESTPSDPGARPWQSYNTVYTNAKAGMEGVDKEKVQRVVYEMSKGSKYFENEARKEAEMRQKIERMRAQCEKLSAAELAHFQMLADNRVVELEATRDLTKIWLHVDMDAFYAAVETLSDPSLKGKPMAVGSMSMISTANYEARQFGVRAAMPGFIARKLCPELIFVPTDFKKYTNYSDMIRKVFQKYDPNFLAASLDEAYLDITEVCKERNIPSDEIAKELRTTVFEETGLTCSAGVAPNRLLAKVCSDINKPNGQFVLPNDRMAVITFISSLPIRKIGGIGKVTENILRDVFGIKTCEDMLQKCGYLCALFSRSSADFFLSVGLGLGKTETPEVRMRKSISNERTFSATGDEALLYQKLAELSELLASDMKKEGLHGRTLTLKLKTAAFEVRTRAITLERYTCSSDDILKFASKLLKAELPASLRLIGLRISHFKEDKLGAPADPMQKTLRHFIKEGSSLRSDTNDRCFADDMETDFSIESHEINHRELGDESDRTDALDTNEKDCPRSKVCRDAMEITTVSSRCRGVDKANSPSAGRIDLIDHQLEESNSLEPDPSLPCMFEVGSSVEKTERGHSMFHNEEPPSSHQEGQFFWLNDYKCSLCGIELPSSFVEERQEHSDFHLAEKLQREESSIEPKSLTAMQRVALRDQTASRPKSKKRKASPKEGGHLPIHVFFGKMNQNF